MIFVINSGSSSLKFKVFDMQAKEIVGGIVERIGLDGPFIKIGDAKTEFNGVPDHADALGKVFKELKGTVDINEVKAFGHRVVHGGTDLTEPTLVDADVVAKLKELYTLAPLHNPPNVMGIEAVMQLKPDVPNVAVFDTGFYRDLPDYVYMYALPYDLYEKHGVRKYGFHGISHEYVAGEAARQIGKPLADLKLVTCHLGSGASVTAIHHGTAVDTSMGFTPLEGLTMSTRCGDIDPIIPVWLMRELKMTPDQVDELMNKQSGTLGISGHKDMRDVIAAADRGDAKGKLALEMFVYDVVRYVGQFMAAMGGCDMVVFTAGVGERSEQIRKMVMDWFAPFGLKHMVVPTDEEGAIARKTLELL